MKYIKSFESINNDEYYHEISSHSEYFDKRKSIVDISQSAIGLIDKHAKAIRNNDILRIERFSFVGMGKIYKFYRVNSEEHIFELKDEWFISRIFTEVNGVYKYRYYLCDQLEGLDRCLSEWI